MSLPFLRKKQSSAVMTKVRQPDEIPEENKEAEGNDGLNACAFDLIHAVMNKDQEGVASALRAAWEILESDEDKDEKDSASPHTYDAQNQLAGESQE